MRLKFSKKLTAAIVIVVVVSGSLLFAYLDRINTITYPDIVVDNSLINQTVSGDFANYSSLDPPSYNFNATTSFLSQNITSDLKLQVINLAPSFFPLNNLGPCVQLQFFCQVTGNISPKLNPTGVLFSATDIGPYSNDNVNWWAYGYPSGWSVTNVSAPKINVTGGWGSYSLGAGFRLLDQSSSVNVYHFELRAYLGCQYYVTSTSTNNVGSHYESLSVSLLGLGKPVSVTINISLEDTS